MPQYICCAGVGPGFFSDDSSGPDGHGESAKARSMDDACIVSENGQFLRRKAAEEYIKRRYGFGGGNFLAKAAHSGDSPPFFKPSARVVLYRARDIDDWVLARLGAPRRSTSEPQK